MADEYIKRSDAIKEISKAPAYFDNGDVQYGLVLAASIIEDTPAADVVEVVRCRDCKHKGWKQEPCHGKSIDVCRIFDLPVDERFYCGCGERKENSKTLSEPTKQTILKSFMKGSDD